MKWKYKDALGIWREGTYQSHMQTQGNDITWFFKRDKSGKFDIVSGQRLKEMVCENNTKAFNAIETKD